MTVVGVVVWIGVFLNVAFLMQTGAHLRDAEKLHRRSLVLRDECRRIMAKTGGADLAPITWRDAN